MSFDESSIRRRATRFGLVLRKNRSRDIRHPGYGGYLLIKPAIGVIAGATPYPFSLTLDEASALISSI